MLLERVGAGVLTVRSGADALQPAHTRLAPVGLNHGAHDDDGSGSRAERPCRRRA